MEKEEDQKVNKWYNQLYEEERSREGIILQQFSLGMIVMGVLINAIIAVQSSNLENKPTYIVAISIIGIIFLVILTVYIFRASEDKMWARNKRKELEEKWGIPIREARCCYLSAINMIKVFFVLIILSWVYYLLII